MKKILIFFLIIAIYMIFITSNPIMLKAENNVNGLNLEKTKDYIENSNILYLCEAKNDIVAIGLGDNKIYLYNKNGDFIHGLKFDVSGMYTFRINDNNEVEIFSVRGSKLYKYSLDGMYLDSENIPFDSEKNNFYINLPKKKKIVIGDNTFIAQGVFITSAGAPLGSTTLIKSSSEEKTIYDSSSSSMKNLMKIIGFVFLWIIMATVGTIYYVKKYKKKKLNEIKS